MQKSDDYIDRLRAEYISKRTTKLKRRIETGWVNGKILDNGAIKISKPKGIQQWYDTRTLVTKVLAMMDRNEALGNGRICYINNKWQLQIRGKHLRRLKKALPYIKQQGNILIDCSKK